MDRAPDVSLETYFDALVMITERAQRRICIEPGCSEPKYPNGSRCKKHRFERQNAMYRVQRAEIRSARERVRGNRA